jgi:activator of HSP90 ATPase
VGAEVSAWDGYISGRNLELVPGERIVQSWRTSEFGDEHEDSLITIMLQEVGGGTLLTLEHSNVPDEQRGYEEDGWQSNYFEPMVAYFSERKEGVAEPAPKEKPRRNAAKKSAAKASANKAAKRPAKSARKAKRTVRAKPKRAASRAKPSPKKSKSKIKPKARSTTTTARRSAKPKARKSGRGKRR